MGEDGPFPTPAGAAIADHTASQNLVAGVLAALYARERTGRGQRVDVSLLGGQVWMQASELTHYLLSGRVPGRANRGPPLLAGIWRVFATADGYLAIVGAGGELWAGFCRAIERPDLAEDPGYARGALTAAQRQELCTILEAVFRTRSTKAWCSRLRAEGQRYAPVQDYAQLAADPQVWANGYLQEVDHPAWGRIATIGSPIALSETPARPGGRAPRVG